MSRTKASRAHGRVRARPGQPGLDVVAVRGRGPIRRALDGLTSTFARAATVLVVAVSLVAAAAALLLTSLGSRTWSSSAEIAPQLSLLDGENGTNVFSLNIDGAKRFVDAQVSLMKGRDVLQPVATAAGVPTEAFASRAAVAPGPSGATVILTVRDAEPRQAEALADDLIKSYAKVRGDQVHALAQSRYDAISSQLDEQRRLGLSGSELAAQLQRDLAAIYVPLNAGPSSVLTRVSSPSVAKPTPRGAVTKALIAFVGTAALVSAVLLARRLTSDRVLGGGDLPTGPGVSALGLLRNGDGDDRAAAQAAALLGRGVGPPSCLVVLSASSKRFDEVAAVALTRGLRAVGRPVLLVDRNGASPGLGPPGLQMAPDAGPAGSVSVQRSAAEEGPGVLAVVAGGWATRLPALVSSLDPKSVLCLVAQQGCSRAELEASLSTIRQVSDLPVGILLLPGRSLP